MEAVRFEKDRTMGVIKVTDLKYKTRFELRSYLEAVVTSEATIQAHISH